MKVAALFGCTVIGVAGAIASLQDGSSGRVGRVVESDQRFVETERPYSGVPSAEPGLVASGEDVLFKPASFLHDIEPMTGDGLVRVVVEIPAGTNAKWEVKSDGVMRWDRKNGQRRVVDFLPYPGNYGMIPRSVLSKERGGDGDPLDVLVLSPSVGRGATQTVRIIGVLKMLDDGEQDDKLLAVAPGTPLGDIESIASLRERHPGALEIIETFFAWYKGPGEMVLERTGDRDEAMFIVETATADFLD